MRAVALAAGVTPGAIYRHFSSREQLIEEAVTAAFGLLEQRIWRALAQHPVGSFERIGALGAMYLEFARQSPGDFRVLFHPAGEGPRRIETAACFSAINILEECVRDAMAAGVLVDDDPRLVALMLWSRLHGLITLFMTFDFSGAYPDLAPDNAIDHVADETRRFIFDGLRRR